MKSEDWFRNKTWNDALEQEFFARLKRSRNKAQYLRIQASYLEKHHPKISLKLLDLLLTQYIELSQLTFAYAQKARCLELIGRHPDDVIAQYLLSLDTERKQPQFKSRACLELGLFIIKNEYYSSYNKIGAILDEFYPGETKSLLFPVDIYNYCIIKASLKLHSGNMREANDYMTMALDAKQKVNSGLRYHPHVGLVKFEDAEPLQKMLSIIADKK